MPFNSNKHLPRAVHYLRKYQDVMLVMALLAEQCGVKTKIELKLKRRVRDGWELGRVRPKA